MKKKEANVRMGRRDMNGGTLRPAILVVSDGALVSTRDYFSLGLCGCRFRGDGRGE
eukprot:COSAG05_NODE_278_length_12330_cov_14.132205_10_plen_56_part_00